MFAIVGDTRKQAFFTSAENIKLENYILQITVTFYIDTQKMLVKPEVKELLVIWGKPHKPAASVAVSRWIKDNYLVHKST